MVLPLAHSGCATSDLADAVLPRVRTVGWRKVLGQLVLTAAIPAALLSVASCAAAPAPVAPKRARPAIQVRSPDTAERTRDVAQPTLEDDVPTEAGQRRPPNIESEGARSHPLSEISDEQLERLLLENSRELGSVTAGTPNAGRLINAVQLPEEPYWVRVSPQAAWGTRETIDYLRVATQQVFERYPDSHPLYVGHISNAKGGHLAPHMSHQSGRDVDIGYFYSEGDKWYARAHAGNLDRERTWAFVRALIAETDVRFILIDRSIQALLQEHAQQLGEDPAWLKSVFRGDGQQPPLIRHAKGHATHMHVRFFNPIAQETARRLYPLLLKHKLIEPPSYFHHHRVKKGENLGKLARRYGTSVKSIMRANRLRSTVIQARKVYLIPQQGTPPPPAVDIPPRRLPPTTPKLAKANEIKTGAPQIGGGNATRSNAEGSATERNLPVSNLD